MCDLSARVRSVHSSCFLIMVMVALSASRVAGQVANTYFRSARFV